MDRGCSQSFVCWVKWQEIIWTAAVIRSAPILYTFNASDLIGKHWTLLIERKGRTFSHNTLQRSVQQSTYSLCIFFENHKPAYPVPTLRPDSHPQQLLNGASWVAHQLNWLCTCRQSAELLCANNRELRQRETLWLKQKDFPKVKKTKQDINSQGYLHFKARKQPIVNLSMDLPPETVETLFTFYCLFK